MGYILSSRSYSHSIWYLIGGVFLLAAGASSLNEVQEHAYDARMPRTQGRPIPLGKLSQHLGLLIVLLLLILGFLLLIQISWVAAGLGIFNVLWYNGVYTYLKRITPFAVVPGSLTGAIPIFMGWTAGGGHLWDATVVFLGGFIFLWQIPHFWLLTLKYAEEYEMAGFPTIQQVFRKKFQQGIILVWIIATSAYSLLSPLFIPWASPSFFGVLSLFNVIFILVFLKLSFQSSQSGRTHILFISFNVYLLLYFIMIGFFWG